MNNIFQNTEHLNNLLPKFLTTDDEYTTESWSLNKLKEDSIICEETCDNEETFYLDSQYKQEVTLLLHRISNHLSLQESYITPAVMLDNM